MHMRKGKGPTPCKDYHSCGKSNEDLGNMSHLADISGRMCTACAQVAPVLIWEKEGCLVLGNVQEVCWQLNVIVHNLSGQSNCIQVPAEPLVPLQLP